MKLFTFKWDEIIFKVDENFKWEMKLFKNDKIYLQVDETFLKWDETFSKWYENLSRGDENLLNWMNFLLLLRVDEKIFKLEIKDGSLCSEWVKNFGD